MTKEQLKKYRTLKAELADLELDIKSKTLHDSVQRSKRGFPYTFGHDHIEGVPDDQYDPYDLIRKSSLKVQIREIEKFVNGIEDFRIRKAVKIYYIDPIDESGDKPTWNSIADKFDDGSTGDSVRMIVKRFQKNIR